VIGPGRYDDVVTLLRAELEAQGVLLVVINGKRGNGVSQQIAARSKEEAQQLASVLAGILGDVSRGLLGEVTSMLEPRNKA
jgi:hypothetical protein